MFDNARNYQFVKPVVLALCVLPLPFFEVALFYYLLLLFQNSLP
jgi:hypothetical protein